jgi:hypothetical protein
VSSSAENPTEEKSKKLVTMKIEKRVALIKAILRVRGADGKCGG